MENITQEVREILDKNMDSITSIENNPKWRISLHEADQMLRQIRIRLGNRIIELNTLITRADLMDEEYTL